MFERFTERSRQVVVLAQDEARLLRHNYIGTEHLLLGLLREEEGLAARVLESLQIGLEDVRARIEHEVGQGEDVPAGQIPFTPKAKKVLECALREALSLKHNYIGTEHVLLGLITVTDGVAVRILQEFDADPEKIRAEVLRSLEESGGAPPPPRLRSWEYQVETVADHDSLTGELLAPLGAEGWELVAIVGEPPGARLVFKRPARP
jgi:ATP-dependent Clp protease ATP-binding subunit ClpC